MYQEKPMYAIVAKKMLEQAGYQVTPADRVPGLWNVEGLARDVTINQLIDLAQQHGHPVQLTRNYTQHTLS
jgi:hypothetical protein